MEHRDRFREALRRAGWKQGKRVFPLTVPLHRRDAEARGEIVCSRLAISSDNLIAAIRNSLFAFEYRSPKFRETVSAQVKILARERNNFTSTLLHPRQGARAPDSSSKRSIQ